VLTGNPSADPHPRLRKRSLSDAFKPKRLLRRVRAVYLAPIDSRQRASESRRPVSAAAHCQIRVGDQR
jgi:NADPH:quinone reductase-like Zn-dependent oxidoreductase